MKHRVLFAAMFVVVGSLGFIASGCGGDDVNGVMPAETIGPVEFLDSGSSFDARGGYDVNQSEASFNIWRPGIGPIVYYGGPVVLGTPNVYFIWYGSWEGSNTPAILEDLVRGFSSTSYSNILAGYYEEPLFVDAGEAGQDANDAGIGDAEAGKLMPKVYASGRVSFARSVYVGYPQGKLLKNTGVFDVVTATLRSQALPYDPEGVYFVMVSPDVREVQGFNSFCEDYCGWHNEGLIDGISIKFAFVGDSTECLDSCSVRNWFQDAGIEKSPNDNWPADSMASVIVHELSEAITDPSPDRLPAWQDAWQLMENGDMCAWRFDPTYPTLNGSRANVRFSGRDYIVQQMWTIDADGGRCDLQP